MMSARMRAFLAAYRVSMSVTKAADAAKIQRRQHYKKLADPVYRKAFDEAHELGVAALEDEAVRRAVEGTLRPVFYQGKPAGAVRHYSDRLLLALLRANKPEKYRDRVEHTGANGAPIESTVTVKFVDVPPE